MYSADLWFGFLCECVVRQVHQASILHCPGCESKLKSALLHLHEQQSLLDKMHSHYQEVRGALLTSLPQLYEQFRDHLVSSGDIEKDKQSYIDAGRQFLIFMSADALYFGRYIDELIDGVIGEAFQVKRKKTIGSGQQPPKRRKVTRNT